MQGDAARGECSRSKPDRIRQTEPSASCVPPTFEPLEPRLLLDGTAEEQALQLFSVPPALFVENLGNGTFAGQVAYPAGDYPWSVTSADVDRDGWVDLVAANLWSDAVSVLRNLGGALSWIGSADAGWHNPANWSPEVVPDPQWPVVIGNPASFEPSLDQDGAAQGVDFLGADRTLGGAGWTLTVGPGGIDSAGAGINTVEPNVSLDANSTWSIGAENTLVLNGTLGGGDHTLIKDGVGTLVLGGSESRISTLVINGGTVRLARGAGPLVLNSLCFGDLLGGLGGSAPASSPTTPPTGVAAAPAAVAREVAQADMVSPVPTATEEDATAEAGALAAPLTFSTAPAVRAAGPGRAEPAANVEAEPVLVPSLAVFTPEASVPPSQAADLEGALVDVLAELALEMPLRV